MYSVCFNLQFIFCSTDKCENGKSTMKTDINCSVEKKLVITPLFQMPQKVYISYVAENMLKQPIGTSKTYPNCQIWCQLMC